MSILIGVGGLLLRLLFAGGRAVYGSSGMGESREEVGMGVVDVGDDRFARQRVVEGIRREKAVRS